MTSYQRGVYYDVFETQVDAQELSGRMCESCKHPRDTHAHVVEDPCDCGCEVDTYILEAVNKVTVDPWWKQSLVSRPHCGCMCHHVLGVRHVAACCGAPPKDF